MLTKHIHSNYYEGKIKINSYILFKEGMSLLLKFRYFFKRKPQFIALRYDLR